jgi:hypothetical protein
MWEYPNGAGRFVYISKKHLLMEQVIYFFENSGYFLDAATLRAKTGLCKSTLHRKLEAIERDYTTVVYGNRKLYHVRILEAFAPAAQ